MVKASTALFAGFCLILGNTLLLALYLQTYSTKGHHLIKQEERTTKPHRQDSTELPAYSEICENGDQEPLRGPARPNLERVAELYWIHSNLSRPLQDHKHYLGEPIRLSDSHMKDTATVILRHRHVCSNYTVAIIVPFRDREPHLQILLGHLIPILRRQRLG